MSGTITANWHLGDLDLTGDDPESDIMDLKRSATVIDLTRGRPEINERLDVLADRESRLAAQGTECELKWKPEHRLMGGHGPSCYTCPHFTQSGDDPCSNVCRIGREQTDLLEELAAVSDLDGLDRELADALTRDIGACEELAEAALAA